MSILLEWDKSGEKEYETGLKRGVLYLQSSAGAYTNGVVWNGLTSVDESPDGADANDFYADDIKYASIRSTESYKGSIGAYMYPDEFALCNGEVEVAQGVSIGQQTRQVFGLCYRTGIGNDVDGQDHGYKLHFVYGATVSPSEKSHETINDSPSLVEMSWDFETVPVNVSGYKPTATIEVDSTKCDATKLAELEAIIYGTAAVEADADAGIEAAEAIPARLPLPDEIIALVGTAEG